MLREGRMYNVWEEGKEECASARMWVPHVLSKMFFFTVAGPIEREMRRVLRGNFKVANS